VIEWYRSHGPRIATVDAVGGLDEIAARMHRALAA
jgi:hypothetical protein